MPYGVKRGVKAPGEWGAGDMAGLALSGAAGIIAALVTDFRQQGETSALFTINRWVVQLGDLLGFAPVPLWMVVVGMTFVGAGSIFYFQPITRQGAFAQGFGLLAVLMTAVPADLAGGLETINTTLPDLIIEELEPTEANYKDGEAGIVPAVFTPAAQGAYVQQVQARQEAAKYDVRLTIKFPNGMPDDIASLIRRGELRGRLHNDDTNETFNLFRSAGGTLYKPDDKTLVVRAGVPARSNSAKIFVRIECRSYAIEEQSATARMGNTLNWTIEMRKSNTPLMLQRLQKSYRY